MAKVALLFVIGCGLTAVITATITVTIVRRGAARNTTVSTESDRSTDTRLLLMPPQKAPVATPRPAPILPKSEPSKPIVSAEDTAKDDIRRCIDGLMREQEKGNLGYRYWKNSDLATQFFSPTSWSVLDVNVFGESAQATVRIESSTKGGMPIRKSWTFFMSNDSGRWEVSLIGGE